jgi:predicted membrane-bound spermidine synthase
LFLTTFATLTLETLDTRLLSVLTWYHLSFFAVSVAMLGMAAGAVHVYLGGERFSVENAPAAMARTAIWFAISIPAGHALNLHVPFLTELTPNGVVTLLINTLALAGPFYLSGVLVALALTRVPGPIGLVYAVDLLGAALGSLMVLVLLSLGNITSAVLGTSLAAALGALCFARYAGETKLLRYGVLALVLGALLAQSALSTNRVRVAYSKGRLIPPISTEYERWTVHGQVVAMPPEQRWPQFWGPSATAVGRMPVVIGRRLVIDGDADTVMTKWDGKRANLFWTAYDVSSMPYAFRTKGDVAIIGAGGGRDVLSALWGEAKSVTGIEINRALWDLHHGESRGFSNLVDQPNVKIVHDEARSYLTHTKGKFDVLQMSLIDTWAATGAGAFTLSENGLYTREAWKVFLDSLKPHGVFSVSRWYFPAFANETARLIALATASLLDAGVKEPSKHMVVLAVGTVATSIISKSPFSEADLAAMNAHAAKMQFTWLLGPGHSSPVPLLDKIASARSIEALHTIVDPEPFDYRPPTDERPYFFNMVKPSSPFGAKDLMTQGGILAGNLTATVSLGALFFVVLFLVALVIIGPLVRSGFPRMGRGAFGLSVGYFAAIGAGFMLIQIGFMQRFSVYLGHPTYAVAVILFSMILATGIGSLISDRIPLETKRGAVIAIPLITAALVGVVALILQPVFEGTIEQNLITRAVITVAVVAPVSTMLGMFFPMGMRLVGRLSQDAMPWMWGINGACGVLASVIAVAISMWSGIHTNFYLALVTYALIAVPAVALWKAGKSAES